MRCSRVGHRFHGSGLPGPPRQVGHSEPGRQGRGGCVEPRPPRRSRAALARTASGDFFSFGFGLVVQPLRGGVVSVI